jgi:multisubunit Na+/H+ antiporter MnhG subunit
VTEIRICVRNLTPHRSRKAGIEMKIVAMILVMLLTMPVSYAMLDEAMKKIKIRNRMG